MTPFARGGGARDLESEGEGGALLAPELMRRLERLRLRAVKGLRRGRREGDARAAGRGGFAEFRDHVAYTPGDDIRRIDWNLYGRVERLYLKEFGREAEPEELFVLDTSGSMAAPPERGRLAARLVTALAFVALRSARSVRLAGSSVGGASGAARLLVGARAIPALAERMERLRAAAEQGGDGDLVGALRRLRESLPEPTGVTIVSDLLVPRDEEARLQRELRGWRASGHEVSILQVVAPFEMRPPPLGRVRLHGAEPRDGAPVEVDLSSDLVRRYMRDFAAFLDSWHRFCTRRGIRYGLVRTDRPLDEILFRVLRQVGMLV